MRERNNFVSKETCEEKKRRGRNVSKRRFGNSSIKVELKVKNVLLFFFKTYAIIFCIYQMKSMHAFSGGNSQATFPQ